MHLNHYFFLHLARELNEKLVGYSLAACFSQEKDELILQWNKVGFANEAPFYIRASFSPEATFLAFPNDYARARLNTVDLFPEALNQTFVSAEVVANERILIFNLSDGLKWVFKFFGNRSNLLLVEEQQVLSIFRTKIEEAETFDFESGPGLSFSLTTCWNEGAELKKALPALGPIPTRYLADRGFFEASFQQQNQFLAQLEQDLKAPKFYLTLFDKIPEVSLIAIGDEIKEYPTAMEALNAYVLERLGNWQLEKERLRVEAAIKEGIRRSEAYLKQTRAKLNERQTESPPELLGHLLMAYGSQVLPGSKEAMLPDFYTGELIAIKLKPELTPVQNAEIYYKKAKNRQIELQRLEANLEFREGKTLQLLEWLELLPAINHLKELRKFAGLIYKETPKQDEEEGSVPFHSYYFMGFEFRVGKNALANDKMLAHFSHKNDTWLHARDSPGSHVLILNRENKKIPASVLEAAAALAAWYSKRRGETLCPVSYTSRKFVQKPKGWAPGKVRLLREEVLMVQPKTLGK